jgi:hypothetical protein
MSKHLKLYIVSILGVRSIVNDKGEPKSLFVHMPWMVEAKNIDDAADQACTEAGKWFPRSEGFVDCDIAVEAVPKEYYERLTIFANVQRLAENPDPKEEKIYFRCDTSSESEEGEDVMVEYDRPVS